MKQKKSALGVLMFLVVSLFGGTIALPVHAATVGSVVINEVAWAGSADSANDEFLELYNTSAQAIDVTGWKIDDDNGSSIYMLSGSIGSHAYYLIEDAENVVNPNVANVIVNLSLANSGDSLKLIDNGGQVIDVVNSSGGAWFAGNATSKATMERIDVNGSGDGASNWANSTGTGSTATSSAGSLIVGTPGMLNSQTAGGSPGSGNSQVTLTLSSSTPQVGQQFTVTVHAQSVTDLFSYGTELTYDPAVLDYQSASQGSFLSQNGVVQTSFQAGLENGIESKLLIAEARTIEPKTGVSGDGILYTMVFNVIGGAGQSTALTFAPTSFLANTTGDEMVNFQSANFVPAVTNVAAVTNFVAMPAAQRYTIQLSWNPSPNAQTYRVYRQNPHGNWVQLGEGASTLFVDSDAIANGGKIVPSVTYHYRVTAVLNNIESAAVETQGVESRGLKSDNNRSDRVDGRDLDALARHFGQSDAQGGFDPLVDSTYDGMVDGNDLIDLGLHFAFTYTP